jgi:hypothetical protein
MRVQFDPEWNPLRALSVHTLAVLLLKEKRSESSIRRELRQAGYLGCEISWAILAAREHLSRLQ